MDGVRHRAGVLIQGRSRRWWLALGVLAGIGLLTKHTMLIWGFAALVGIMLTPLRRDLRTRVAMARRH